MYQLQNITNKGWNASQQKWKRKYIEKMFKKKRGKLGLPKLSNRFKIEIFG